MYRKNVMTTLAAVATVGMLLGGCANQAGTPGGAAPGGEAGAVSIPAITALPTPKNAVLPAGNGKAKCAPTTTIAYVGAETGPNAQLGINIFNGVQLAMNQHNQANPGCQVQFKKFDTEGDANKATGPVAQVTKEPSIIGVVGTAFSGESRATGNIFEQVKLVHITPAATSPNLTLNGWTTFFRGLGSDDVQGPAAAKLMTGKLGAKKVYLVLDDSEFGTGMAKTTSAGLGDALIGTDKVTQGQKDFSAAISKIINSKADAVFYSGYYAEGAPFDQQLMAKGYKGTFVGPDALKDDQFIKQAGDASANAFFTCACAAGELIPTFATAYKALNKVEPGTYSVEGYDAATILLSGIDAGNQDRATLLRWVEKYDADGLGKHYKWDEKGELNAPTVYGYKVEDGKIVPIGAI